MVYGTEKIFTSFKIAQQIAGTGERVLFLVPFLALMSHTIREWTRYTEVPFHSFVVYSDT